jgi:hypothetical protein
MTYFTFIEVFLWTCLLMLLMPYYCDSDVLTSNFPHNNILHLTLVKITGVHGKPGLCQSDSNCYDTPAQTSKFIKKTPRAWVSMSGPWEWVLVVCIFSSPWLDSKFFDVAALLYRASLEVLSMPPCKNISHIKVFISYLFPTPPIKTETGTTNTWETTNNNPPGQIEQSTQSEARSSQ